MIGAMDCQHMNCGDVRWMPRQLGILYVMDSGQDMWMYGPTNTMLLELGYGVLLGTGIHWLRAEMSGRVSVMIGQGCCDVVVMACTSILSTNEQLTDWSLKPTGNGWWVMWSKLVPGKINEIIVHGWGTKW